MVERWFGELTTKLIQRGVHKSVQALEADIRAWIETWNEDPRPYVWTKTADEIPRQHRGILPTDFRRGTLARRGCGSPRTPPRARCSPPQGRRCAVL